MLFYAPVGSLIPYVGLLAGAGKDVTLLKPTSCGKNICPPGFTGQVCDVEIGIFSDKVLSPHPFVFSRET